VPSNPKFFRSAPTSDLARTALGLTCVYSPTAAGEVLLSSTMQTLSSVGVQLRRRPAAAAMPSGSVSRLRSFASCSVPFPPAGCFLDTGSTEGFVTFAPTILVCSFFFFSTPPPLSALARLALGSSDDAARRALCLTLVAASTWRAASRSAASALGSRKVLVRAASGVGAESWVSPAPRFGATGRALVELRPSSADGGVSSSRLMAGRGRSGVVAERAAAAVRVAMARRARMGCGDARVNARDRGFASRGMAIVEHSKQGAAGGAVAVAGLLTFGAAEAASEREAARRFQPREFEIRKLKIIFTHHPPAQEIYCNARTIYQRLSQLCSVVLI
jgi:hypothetical protein